MSDPASSTPSAGPLTLLIVDDHFVVRSGLVASLEMDGTVQVVAEADHGEAAVEAYRQHRPAVVLMDVQLPGMGGIAATAAICAMDPEARILIYSSYVRDDEIRAALEAGALGYVQKSTTLDDLMGALRVVAQGSQHLSPELAQQLAMFRSSPTITPREREILRLVATGCANKNIADSLGISEDTVKRHVSHILQKMGVRDRAQASVEAIRRGIVKVPV